MIILDTCALIFDALTPQKLSEKTKKTIDKAGQDSKLFCCDISLWEVAMLIQKKRLDPGVETAVFLELILGARGIKVLPINVEIASIACDVEIFNHGDPADRIIAATAIHYDAKLITADKMLKGLKALQVIW